ALRSFIGENNISGVVIVSGDLHQGSLDSGTASGFPEIVVPQPNTRRTGNCATATPGVWDVGFMTGVCNGYAVLEFDTGPHELTLTLKNQEGTTLFSHTTTP
ncbi:MAG: hypothetical protein L0Z68_10760, partial [Gammaproteobacteria bacterium]|nr:hypothetical protein [Gammaproteobacteria bacterium]